MGSRAAPGVFTSASARRFDADRYVQRRRGARSTMRIVRRLVYALLLVLTLAVGAAAAAIIVSQTAWFKDWLRGYIVREAHQYLNGNLSIERLGGNLFFGLEMENIG